MDDFNNLSLYFSFFHREKVLHRILLKPSFLKFTILIYLSNLQTTAHLKTFISS